MKVVFSVETAMREIIQPDKINLASLGNKTPHLHWHIIPRFEDDKHFPNSHWGEARNDATGLKHSSAGLQANIHAPFRESILSFKDKIKAHIECALAN